MLENNFWQDKLTSQKIIKEKKLYEELINSYDNSIKSTNDLHELNELALEEKNQPITHEILESLKNLKKRWGCAPYTHEGCEGPLKGHCMYGQVRLSKTS